jgi:hypothetical protein
MTYPITLQRDIAALSHIELWALDEWFSELRDARWDAETERDAAAGKFGALANVADVRARPLVQGL